MEIQGIDKNIVNVLSSGSKGNCEIYHSSIACDMGVSFQKIAPFVKELQLVLLSHRHS